MLFVSYSNEKINKFKPKNTSPFVWIFPFSFFILLLFFVLISKEFPSHCWRLWYFFSIFIRQYFLRFFFGWNFIFFGFTFIYFFLPCHIVICVLSEDDLLHFFVLHFFFSNWLWHCEYCNLNFQSNLIFAWIANQNSKRKKVEAKKL